MSEGIGARKENINEKEKGQYLFFKDLDTSRFHPELADFLTASGPDNVQPAGQAWGSKGEMDSSTPSAHPHGTVENVQDASGPFQRIWSSDSKNYGWYNTYGIFGMEVTPPAGYTYETRGI